MRLEAKHPVHHLGASALERLGPVDVRFLVKARLQLHHHHHFLAQPHRLAQKFQQLQVRAGAINGLLDGDHRRVKHGFAQQRKHRIEALVRLVHQRVPGVQMREQRAGARQINRPARRPGREQQRGLAGQIDQLRQAHQIHRAFHAVHGRLGQFKLVQQEGAEKLRAAR